MSLLKIILFILLIFHTLSFLILIYEKLSSEEKINWWRLILIYVKEFLALLYIFILWPFGFFGLEGLVPRYKGGLKTPIFLIPGAFMTRASMYPLFLMLRNRKVENIFILDPFPFGGGIEDISLQVVKNIKRITEILGADQIILIGFSVGGIVARYIAMNQEQFNINVRKYVCVSSPHKGTRMAYFFPGTTMREVRPNSRILKKLEEIDKGEFSLNIGAKFDQFVISMESLAPHSNSIIYDSCGHFSILFARDVADKILEYITIDETRDLSQAGVEAEEKQPIS